MKTQKDTFPSHTPALRTAAVLLAAGSASRMGGQPKCLLQLDGRSLIVRQIQALQAVGLNDIVVVLGHYSPAIAAVVVRAVASASAGIKKRRIVNGSPCPWSGRGKLPAQDPNKSSHI